MAECREKFGSADIDDRVVSVVAGSRPGGSWRSRSKGFWLDDEGSGAKEVFLFDFDGPDPSTNTLADGLTLGNDIEVTIGGGDSGGPNFLWSDANRSGLLDQGELTLFGVNTFTASVVDGPLALHFGSLGGGMIVSAYLSWINTVIDSQAPTVTSVTDADVFSIDTLNPRAASITLADSNPTNAASVQFTVTFTESVTNVDALDFALNTSGVAGASITIVGIGGNGVGFSRGVRIISGGAITSGYNAIEIQGQGSGTGNTAYGVSISAPFTRVTAVDGDIQVSGASGGGSSAAIELRDHGKILVTGDADIHLSADSINIAATSAVSAVGNTVSLQTLNTAVVQSAVNTVSLTSDQATGSTAGIQMIGNSLIDGGSARFSCTSEVTSRWDASLTLQSAPAARS